MEEIKEVAYDDSEVADLSQNKYPLKDYKPESQIIIETVTGIVVHGRYCKTQGNGANILIDFISEFPSQTHCNKQTFVCYSAHEIKYLHIFDEEEDVSNYSIACPIMSGITYKQFLAARDLIWNNKYVPVYDCNFQNTLKEIRSSDVIGIAAIGSHSDKVRLARTSFFVIATRNKIFLFDILLTPKNFWEMGLKNVLEDKKIQKVVYDSKTVADLLFNRYHVKIANVFDVIIADYEICNKFNQIYNKCEFKKFPELIQTYLNLPQGIFEYTELVVTGVTHKNRPVREKMKRDISLVAVFLIPLCDVQKAILLQHFYMATQVYGDLLVSRSDPCCVEKLEEINNGVPVEVMNYVEHDVQEKTLCNGVKHYSCSDISSSNSVPSK